MRLPGHIQGHTGQGMLDCVAKNDWEAWADYFAEDGTFVNSFLKEPIRGRAAVKAASAHWPRVDNRPEWVVIEGDRPV